MHPVVALVLSFAGAAALVRWCAKEVHRVNATLDEVRAQEAAVEPPDRATLPTLKLDPASGEYRPG